MYWGVQEIVLVAVGLNSLEFLLVVKILMIQVCELQTVTVAQFWLLYIAVTYLETAIIVSSSKQFFMSKYPCEFLLVHTNKLCCMVMVCVCL